MALRLLLRFPVTSSIRHFIFCVTSSQREKLSLHTSHFIQVHYIPCGTSYQSHFIPVHFIPRPLHTGALHTKATSYQSLHTDCHFIPMHFIPRSLHISALHTKVTSYRGHFIPKSNQSLRTNALHTSAIHTSHFMPVTLYQSLNPCAFHISALRTEFTLLSSYLIECTSD